MSEKNNYTKIFDLCNISRVLKKVREIDSKIKFSRIAARDDLIVVGIGDASFKSEEKAVGGVLLFLANSQMKRASLIYWKAKIIFRVCHSSRQVEILLDGDYKKRIKVHLFTDSKATLESIASSKQIYWKTLRLILVDLKESLVEEDNTLYSWLSTNSIWADILTKMHLPSGLEKMIKNNIIDLPETMVNQVKAFGKEIWMTNICN